MGLGTYGFIKNPTAFLVGATENGPHALEDFGYLMERAVLCATDLGLGTCWLGGSFTKSSFAKKIDLSKEEILPAVVSAGYAVEGSKDTDRIRRMAGASSRIPTEKLFFEGSFETPIPKDVAGSYEEALELTRWAPSASNRQPWRVVHNDSGWHFFLERTKGYGKGSLAYTLLRIADLQRLDIGIAMCHFEAAVREKGFGGSWLVEEPTVTKADKKVEYIATWRPA
jgi:hypothetical protein